MDLSVGKTENGNRMRAVTEAADNRNLHTSHGQNITRTQKSGQENTGILQQIFARTIITEDMVRSMAEQRCIRIP